MKAAHFSIMAPHRMGLYGTVKDLIKGERQQGIDAVFVDFDFEGDGKCRIMEDGWLKTVDIESVWDSDILVKHTSAPTRITDRIPHLLALHGRPINTFLLSFQDRKNPLIETIYQVSERKNFKGFICFWPRNTRVWETILPGFPIYQVPAPVDLEMFTPEGKVHKFGGEFDFRILIADMWREDSCPVTVFFKALETAENLFKTTGIRVQVNALGTPKRARELYGLIKGKSGNKYIGEIFPMVENPEILFRAADAVLTSHGLATRIVRESLACGTPVITTDPTAGYDSYAPEYHEGETDLGGVVIRLMMKPREDRREECRAYAEMVFDPIRAGAVMKDVFERALK